MVRTSRKKKFHMKRITACCHPCCYCYCSFLVGLYTRRLMLALLLTLRLLQLIVQLARNTRGSTAPLLSCRCCCQSRCCCGSFRRSSCCSYAVLWLCGSRRNSREFFAFLARQRSFHWLLLEPASIAPRPPDKRNSKHMRQLCVVINLYLDLPFLRSRLVV